MRVQRLNSLAMGVLLALAGSASGVSAMSLNEALSIAYEGNPTIRAERFGDKGAKAQIWEAAGSMLPTVTLQATKGRSWYEVDYSSNFVSPGGSGGGGGLGGGLGGGGAAAIPTQKGSLDSETYGVVAEQVIFAGGRPFNAFRQVRALSDLSGYELLQTESQVLVDGVTAYMDVLTNDAVVAFSEANISVLREHLSAADTRFEVGEITRTDVAQARARLAGGESALAGARAQQRAAHKAFLRVFGRAPESLIEPSNLPPLPTDEMQARNIANTSAPALNMARAAEDAASRALWVARGEFLPTVMLRGEYSKQEGTSPQTDSQTNKSVMAVASWPIFEGGAKVARSRKASFEQQKALLTIHATERQIEEMVSVTWEQLVAAQASIRSDESQVLANELALNGVRSEASVGSRSTLDVLNAEQELLNSRVALVRSKRNEVVAAYQLLAVLGLFTPEHVGFADIVD